MGKVKRSGQVKKLLKDGPRVCKNARIGKNASIKNARSPACSPEKYSLRDRFLAIFRCSFAFCAFDCPEVRVEDLRRACRFFVSVRELLSHASLASACGPGGA